MSIRFILSTCLILLCLLPLPGQTDCPVEGLTPIAELKGERGHAREGQRVRVRGVVTGDFRGDDRLNGFYLQSGDPARGIFVYAPAIKPGSEPIAPGREVVLAARADAYRGQRQLSRVTQVLACGEPGLPEARVIPLPETDRDAWRHQEGRLVRFEGPLTITGNYDLARYGSLDLVVGDRLFRPGNFPDRAPRENPAAHRLILDDAHYRLDPDPIPYLDEHGTRRAGDRLPELTGILTRAFGHWRVHPLDSETLAFENSNPRPLPPERAGRYRLAAFNVENYFLNLGDRGAADADTLAAQQRALGAVATGLDADLIGLIEVENDPAAVDDLVSRLGQVANDAEYRHFDMDEAVGADAIRSVLAWRSDRVELLAGPFINDSEAHHRPVIAGHFRFGEQGPGTLVAVIHHKSKGSCPSSGDVDKGQGCWNALRTRQSQALAAFLERKRQETGTDRVIIIGDINSYGAEDPVTALVEAGYTDLVAEHLPPEGRYSYVFHGEAGYLDTAMASPALAEDIADIRFWHINADEPRFLRFRRNGPHAGPWRSSDHDPVIIDLRASE